MSSTPAIELNKSSTSINLATVNETSQSIAKKTPARSYEELTSSCDSMEEGTTLEHRGVKEAHIDVGKKNKAKPQPYKKPPQEVELKDLIIFVTLCIFVILTTVACIFFATGFFAIVLV